MSEARARGVILAGGEGTRLRPLTYYFQKAMLPIGPRQRPLLEYVLELLRLNGIEEVVLLLGYKADQVMNYFGDGSGVGLRITYVLDEPGLKGTLGALFNALGKGAIRGDDTLLVYYGDILTNMGLRSLLSEHRRQGAAATLAVARRYRLPVGVVELRGNRVLSIREKPELELNVTIGVLALEARALQGLEPRPGDIMGDLVPLLIARGERVLAYVTEAFWYDVGSVERYERLNSEVDFSALDALLHEGRGERTGALG